MFCLPGKLVLTLRKAAVITRGTHVPGPLESTCVKHTDCSSIQESMKKDFLCNIFSGSVSKEDNDIMTET